MKEELTQEEKQLALSAKDAHVLIDMVNGAGWKVIRKMYIDVTLNDIREYLDDTKNTDMFMIQAKRELRKWIQRLLDDVQLTVNIGLEHEKELINRKKR